MSEQHGAASVDFVAAFTSAAEQVIDTVGSCDLAAPVPACPGWSAYDLVVHLGNVHGWAASVLETGEEAPRQHDAPPGRRAKVVARWYAAKAADLLEVLRSTVPARACWTFSPTDRTSGFWLRRQAHEATVHLVDLQRAQDGTASRGRDDSASAVLPGVTPALAADGALEVLEVFLPRMHGRGRPADLRRPLLVHATDTADTWLLTPGAGPPAVRPVVAEDEVGDQTDLLAAPAAALMLLLWRRLPPEHELVSLDGDRERMLAFLRSPLTA